MDLRTMIVAYVMLASMVALSALSDPPSKSLCDAIAKSQKSEPSAFGKEFRAWADKQDWFELSDKAEFGDMNRRRNLEKGLAFGYSLEFADSSGEKHLLGIGLAKEPDREVQKSMRRGMAEMCAQKNLMMHGQPVSTNATGGASPCVARSWGQ